MAPHATPPQRTERLGNDQAGVQRAAALLREGRLVAFGTETVYGLGADATSNAAVASIFDAKGRPHFNPLICHYPDAAAAFAHVQAPEAAQRLAALFWPGPLTLVLPKTADCAVAELATAGLDTVAISLNKYPNSLIDVYGHTDATGTDGYNQTLSENRARMVADYLSSRGVNQARIRSTGFGKSQPVASNDTPEGRAANRRVEIKIVPVSQDDVARAHGGN